MNQTSVVKNGFLVVGGLLAAIVVVILIRWVSPDVKNFLDWKLSYDSGFFSAGLEASASGVLDLNESVPISSVNNVLPAKVLQDGDLTVNAESALLAEISNGSYSVLFQKDQNQKLPIASLTKLMTALVVLERYDLSQKVFISSEVMKQEGEQGELKEGQVLSLENLLYMTLIESSNRAAYALAQAMGTDNFILAMNQRAQDLGMTNTHFVDSSGLSPDSYSSAKDVLLLTKYLFENYPLFNEIIGLKEYNIYLNNGELHHKLINTNVLLGQVPGVIGGKTGFTDEAKGCLMVIQKNERDNNYLIYVVLGADDRFGQTMKMINWVRNPYQF